MSDDQRMQIAVVGALVLLALLIVVSVIGIRVA